jgi:ferric-dicitrate binding protein FerR (iron transport regulator)
MSGSPRASTAKLWLLLVVLSGVCLAQMPPIDAPQHAAKVLTLTGDVSVLKDSQPWALQVGDFVQVKQLIISGGDGHAVFQVTDGSTFEVFPNSQVVFRSSAPNWMELLDVFLGRVRVHIEHLGNKPNPNRVVTPAAVISVRGTTFDILVEDQDSSTVVQVEDGQVEVQHRLLPGTPKLLNPGDSLRVYKSQPLASSLIDRGTIWRQALRMILDAATTYETRMPRVGGIGQTGSGDTGKTNIPPPPPAPPAPPPAPPAPPPIP